MHFTYIHNGQNAKQKENGNYMYGNYIWWQKEFLLFQIYLIYAGRSLAGFYSSGTRTGIYFHNYLRCCWRRPWWDDVFPCGSTLFINFPNKNVRNITEIDIVFMRTFPRKEVFISPYMRNFPKREWMDSVDPRGNTPLQGLHQQQK